MISTETVRTDVRNAMAKTGARTRVQLVAMALALWGAFDTGQSSTGLMTREA